MDRRDLLRAGALACVGGVAGVTGCTTPGTTFREGFEDGIGDWTGDAAIGPEVDVAEFEWTTPTLSTDTLSVAVGTSVIWEGDATHFVDVLSVELTPR